MNPSLNQLRAALGRYRDAAQRTEQLRVALQASGLLDREPYMALARVLSAAVTAELEAREAVLDWGRAVLRMPSQTPQNRA